TEAMPWITSPSPGITSPASTTTVSPLRSTDAGTFCSRLPSTKRRAVVSWRILRKLAAWALPRPSATASAKLAKTTVNQSQKLTLNVNQSGEHAADLDDEHDRVLDHVLRHELAKALPNRRPHDFRIEERTFF